MVKMPPIADRDEYPLSCLMALGYCKSTLNGYEAIPPSELETWSRSTGYPLSPWQFETIMLASQEYAALLSKKNPPLPWQEAGATKEEAQQRAKSAIRAAFART